MPDPVLLFTAFEPSGDAHAAPVIAAIRRTRPEIPIFGCGGARMEAAGASLIERTTDQAAMGLSALSQISRVRGIIKSIEAWAAEEGRQVAVHVPVDSPAANFPLCKRLRRRGARTVHLVAPQLWAWAPWRIGKLRRLTDQVLCLLPFEEQWFTSRGVPATFVGHPIINRELDEDFMREAARALPGNDDDDEANAQRKELRLAIFPGSRTHEVERNLPLLFETWRALRQRRSEMHAAIIAAGPAIAEHITQMLEELDSGPPPRRRLPVEAIDADAAVWWCDVAVTVSGTMSLGVARQYRPMVGVYHISRASMLLSKLIIRTPHRLLPNVIAGRRIVPEFVPYAGGADPIVEAVERLFRDPKARETQAKDLAEVVAQFDGHDFAEEAAGAIVGVMR